MIAVVGLPAWAGSPDGEGSAAGLAVAVAAAAHARGAAVELAGKIGDDGAGDAVVVALGRLGIGHAALLRDPAHATPVLAAAEEESDEASRAGADVATVDAGPAIGEESDRGAPSPDEIGPTLLPADPAQRPGLDAADLDLALRYLPGPTTVVLADPMPDAAITAAMEAAAFAGARLIVLVPAGGAVPDATAAQAGGATLVGGATQAADAIVLETPEQDDGSFGRLVGFFAAALDAGREPAAAFRQAVESAGWERIGR